MYYGCGAVFSLSPSNGGWVYTMLYAFTGVYADQDPRAGVSIDAADNLYGTTFGSDKDLAWGNIYELSPSNGSWTYTSLHEFTGGTDGGQSVSNVVKGIDGNLYGTASLGGSNDGGVIWEVTP
jgi:uncharacterized repeat protein (TIGR03803 family)